MTELIDIKVLSKKLSIKEGELRKMMMRREIPYVKLSARRVRFVVSDVERLIKERTVTAKAVGQ